MSRIFGCLAVLGWCDWDGSRVVGVLSSLRANRPSGRLGPVPLLELSCSNGVIGLLINLR